MIAACDEGRLFRRTERGRLSGEVVSANSGCLDALSVGATQIMAIAVRGKAV